MDAETENKKYFKENEKFSYFDYDIFFYSLKSKVSNECSEIILRYYTRYATTQDEIKRNSLVYKTQQKLRAKIIEIYKLKETIEESDYTKYKQYNNKLERMKYNLSLEKSFVRRFCYSNSYKEIKKIIKKIAPLIKKQSDESKKRCVTHFKTSIDFLQLPHDIENLIFNLTY